MSSGGRGQSSLQAASGGRGSGPPQGAPSGPLPPGQGPPQGGMGRGYYNQNNQYGYGGQQHGSGGLRPMPPGPNSGMGWQQQGGKILLICQGRHVD